MKTDQVAELLKEAEKLAKAQFKGTVEPLAVVGIAQMLADAQRREKKVVPSLAASSRPDPVQVARKTPRQPLMAATPAPKKKKAASTRRR